MAQTQTRFVPPAYNMRSPATMRGMLMLETASELAKTRG